MSFTAKYTEISVSLRRNVWQGTLKFPCTLLCVSLQVTQKFPCTFQRNLCQGTWNFHVPCDKVSRKVNENFQLPCPCVSLQGTWKFHAPCHVFRWKVYGISMYLARCFVKGKKLTEITSITDKFANRFVTLSLDPYRL